jgi:hypothetical protein
VDVGVLVALAVEVKVPVSVRVGVADSELVEVAVPVEVEVEVAETVGLAVIEAVGARVKVEVAVEVGAEGEEGPCFPGQPRMRSSDIRLDRTRTVRRMGPPGNDQEGDSLRALRVPDILNAFKKGKTRNREDATFRCRSRPGQWA